MSLGRSCDRRLLGVAQDLDHLLIGELTLSHAVSSAVEASFSCENWSEFRHAGHEDGLPKCSYTRSWDLTSFPMSEIAELRIAPQEEINTDLSALLRGAVEMMLETALAVSRGSRRLNLWNPTVQLSAEC